MSADAWRRLAAAQAYIALIENSELHETVASTEHYKSDSLRLPTPACKLNSFLLYFPGHYINRKLQVAELALMCRYFQMWVPADSRLQQPRCTHGHLTSVADSPAETSPDSGPDCSLESLSKFCI